MPAINIKQMKITEPSRNFDATVNAETNIPAEDSTGLSGGFKFFTGIKAFFKGISALGTLTTTSRIPVTDNNGNVSYTTPTAIKDLFNISKATALTSNDDLNNVKTEGFYFSNGAVLPTNAPSGTSATLYNYVLHVYPQGNTSRVVQEFTTLNGQNKYMRFYGVSGNTWSSWQKLATETDTPTYKTVTVTTNENGAILSITGVDLTKVLSVSCTSDADLICTIFNGSYQYIRVRTYQGTNKANTSVTLNLVLKR